ISDLGMMRSLFSEVGVTPINVVSGAAVGPSLRSAALAEAVFDPSGILLRMFPGLSWPASLVIDPGGALVAILADDAFDVGLSDPFGRSVRPVSGAIDRHDVNF